MGTVEYLQRSKSIERQIRNIQAENNKAVIVQEVFTGTKDNRA